MARLFRSLFALVLVFGFSVVSCLGVNADEQLYEATPYSFTQGWYESTVGDRVLLNNITDTQKVLDKTNTGNELPIYINQDYHAPKYSGRQPIDDSINLMSLSDIGYISSFRVTGYNTSLSDDQRQYYGYNYVRWAQPFTVENQSSVWTSGAGIYINTHVDSSVLPNLVITLGSDAWNYPSFEAGQTYEISFFISGLPDGCSMNLNMSPDCISSFTDYPSVDGYVSQVFTVSKDFSFSDTNEVNNDKFWISNFPSGWEGDLQFQSFVLANVSDRGVEQAIRDQTDDMNKNHDETMDKIDDVTDFDDTEQGQMSGDVDDVTNSFNEKMGILSFADSIFDQFFGLFETDNKQPGLVLPEFSIEVQNTSYTVWEEQTFDLSQLDGWFSGLMTAVRFATSFLIYAALIMYIQKIFGAIVQDWSDR